MQNESNLYEDISELCLDDSTKVIRYLKEQEKKQKPYNLATFILTIISATASVVAAVTGIITLLK